MSTVRMGLMFLELAVLAICVPGGLAVYNTLCRKLGIMLHAGQAGSIVGGGGLIFATMWLMLLLWLDWAGLTGLMLFIPPLLLIVITGYIDDVYCLPPWVRLLLQLVSAELVYQLIGYPDLPWLGDVVIIKHVFFSLVFVWSVNLYNFMDGSDGYATTQAIVIFLMFSICFLVMQQFTWATSTLGLVLALLMFLIWNWPPAVMYMGDVGSTFLGASIAIYAYYVDLNFDISWVYAYILLSPFVLDATLSLFRKIARGQRLIDRHSQHAFQRLLAVGISEKQLITYLLLVSTMNSGLIGLSIVWHWSQLELILITAISLLVIYGMIETVCQQSNV